MRLLVVEDEPHLLSSLAEALREDGYAVDAASDGEDGLAKAMMWDYNAIVLDVMMPVMDGFQVLERLRLHKKTPILMLTARHGTKDRVRGLDGGADDYLAKPYELPELLARIRALIRRSTGHAAAIVTIGDVSVDTVGHTVTKGGEPVTLTAREIALIEYLALHRGRVITRERLYEQLFDENESSLSNLLDVYVSNVRRKLGHDLIVTRRGLGYAIE
ncbi:MAG: response regulator transcription factor [Prosthecobacter sp.]|uniref:response regulator transcription factor n=1 Tax=Prosthecobacter sp. TaxID=1965333 RepID=UPI003900A29C